MRFTRITIIRTIQPKDDSVNEDLKWLGSSLGLFNLRDKDKSCFRIFITLVRNLKTKTGLTSDEIAMMTGLTRGTVVHHLNKMMASGIVFNERGKYYLTVENLEGLVELVQKNVNNTMEEIKKVAQHVDRKLNL
ncbi:ArsR family transcriptional regulator [Candidatus Woesearchaeota archaeon]|nr:ArsR family transcriptional regulator [Candidatus Woesearchaeota archaeon]